jgi:hypothetical protein
MRDRPISTCQHTTITTEIHDPGGIRTRNPSKRPATDPHLRPRGHRDRLTSLIILQILLQTRCIGGGPACNVIISKGRQILKKKTSRTYRFLKIRTPRSLEKLGSNHPLARRSIPEKRNPQLYSCENLKIPVINNSVI